MTVQLKDVVLVVVHFLARWGHCLSEHSRAHHLKLLRRGREEGFKSLVELWGQPVTIRGDVEQT